MLGSVDYLGDLNRRGTLICVFVLDFNFHLHQLLSGRQIGVIKGVRVIDPPYISLISYPLPAPLVKLVFLLASLPAF